MRSHQSPSLSHSLSPSPSLSPSQSRPSPMNLLPPIANMPNTPFTPTHNNDTNRTNGSGIGMDSYRSQVSEIGEEFSSANITTASGDNFTNQPSHHHHHHHHRHHISGHHHNEDEDELGVAKDSKYHSLSSPQRAHNISIVNGRITRQSIGQHGSRSGQGSIPTHGINVLPSTLGGDVAMDVGSIDVVPFSNCDSPANLQIGFGSTVESASDGSAFLKGREMRLTREDQNRFQFNTSMASSATTAPLNASAAVPIAASSSPPSTHSHMTLQHDSLSSMASSLLDSSLGPDALLSSNRRELRATMERKEEAIAQARLRGSSLLSFASGSGTIAPDGTLTTLQTLKPYVKYTPKYNLPFGDKPREVAPVSNSTSLPSASGSSSTHPVEEDLAQVRSTTLFSMTGNLNTHVGITLNTQVFNKSINADIVAPMGRRSTANGRRSGSANGNATNVSTAAGAMLSLIPSPSSSSSSSTSIASESVDLDEKANPSDTHDPTFLTSLNLNLNDSHHEQSPTHANNRLIPAADFHYFSTLTSVESAVQLLPRLLRPTPDSLIALRSRQEEFLRHGGKMAHLPTPPLPVLDVPPRVDLAQVMELALESLNFKGQDSPTHVFNPNASLASQSIVQLRESTFKSYFYSHQSQAIIKDTYYWVLLYFFSGGDRYSSDATPGRKGRRGNRGQEHAPEDMPEMYAYRAYASNLKKYAEQEGFVRKQKEWRLECERIRQAERDSHAQVGTQVQQSASINSLSTPTSNNSAPSPNPSLPPNHKDDLIFPPPPIQTSKQKRQPLVLLGDIPHFPVNEKLNTGPIPKAGLFEPIVASSSVTDSLEVNSFTDSSGEIVSSTASSLRSDSSLVPSTRVDYTSTSFLLTTLKSRISTHFVQLFLQISAAHKDFFYLHYYDILAQIIYYSFLVAYPTSRPLVNHTFFKLRLLQLTSYWMMGFIPSNLSDNLTKWRGDIQFITGEAGVNKRWSQDQHANQSNMNPSNHFASSSPSTLAGPGSISGMTSPSTFASASASGSGLGSGSSLTTDQHQHDSTSSAALDDDMPMYATSGNTNGNVNNSTASISIHTSQYISQLDKKLQSHLQSSCKSARQRVLASAGSNSSVTGTGSGSVNANMAGTSSLTSLTGNPQLSQSKKKSGSYPPVDLSTSIGHLSTTSVDLTGDLLVDVGDKATRNPHRVPLRVTRRKVELHHSALIADFLQQRHFANQSNHALRIPLTVPSNGDEHRSAFLDDLVGYNESQRQRTLDLKSAYAASKVSFNRLQSKHKKDSSEIVRKHDQERERALREASAFSKTLVAEYEQKKYEDLKAPSKSLALRRLGHFRDHGEKGFGTNTNLSLQTSKSETSSTLIKSALMLS